MKLRAALLLAVIAGIASIWLLLDQKHEDVPTPPVASLPQAPAPVTTSSIVQPKKSTPAVATPIDDEDEPDPYPSNEITLPAEGYGDSAHPVASDIRTGADDDEDLADKLGSAFVPEDESPEDGARFTQQ